MTSIPAYYLSRNLEDIKLDKSSFESIGNILDKEGYNIYNVNVSYEMRRDYWKTFLKPVDKKYWPKGCKVMESWNNQHLNTILFNMLEKGAFNDPFFLYVHYNFRRDHNCNDLVQQLIDRLKEENLYDDSIIIVHSDHGMPDLERRNFFKWLDDLGLYYNRHDLIMTDDNICVPLVLKYPGCKMREKIDTTVGTIDIVPTVLDILQIEYGREKQYGQSFRGVSLLPLMNEIDIHKFKSRKIRTDTRYIAQKDRITSIRGTGYKYILYRDVPGLDNELFMDLNKDKYETKNLINTKEKEYINLIKEYKDEFNWQEEDSYQYQTEHLIRKFQKNFSKNKLEKRNINKILVLGSCNYQFMKIINEIIKDSFGEKKQVDLFLERDNPIEYHELNKFGFTNNIFAHHSFKASEFKKDYLSTFFKYDLLIVPITDYKMDIEQAKSKTTKGEMKMQVNPLSAQTLTARFLKDYKEIFKIAKLVKTKNILYMDYNMNFYSNPRLSFLKKYFKKIQSKKDIYRYKPLEFIKDIKRVIVKG
jgi:hypothetical protein